VSTCTVVFVVRIGRLSARKLQLPKKTNVFSRHSILTRQRLSCLMYAVDAFARGNRLVTGQPKWRNAYVSVPNIVISVLSLRTRRFPCHSPATSANVFRSSTPPPALFRSGHVIFVRNDTNYDEYSVVRRLIGGFFAKFPYTVARMNNTFTVRVPSSNTFFGSSLTHGRRLTDFRHRQRAIITTDHFRRHLYGVRVSSYKITYVTSGVPPIGRHRDRLMDTPPVMVTLSWYHHH